MSITSPLLRIGGSQTPYLVVELFRFGVSVGEEKTCFVLNQFVGLDPALEITSRLLRGERWKILPVLQLVGCSPFPGQQDLYEKRNDCNLTITIHDERNYPSSHSSGGLPHPEENIS